MPLLLTKRELLLLDALAKHRSVKDAAIYLRNEMDRPEMTDNTCYLILHRLRKKYLNARSFINTMLSQRQRSPLLKQVLTPKVPIVDEAKA